ncbi:hypothetical protein I2900191A2_13950 [Intestinibacter bartlettii]|uniref:AAA domain-containing protein n=1 Tax=Intestinibacter bartlettii TaxID=261299 RepID=UPI0034AC49D1
MSKILGKRYILGEEIYKDDDSRVILYEAKDKTSKELLAIKVFNMKEDKNIDLKKELFSREYHSLVNLKHNNIVKYIDAGKDEDILYIVMEYLDYNTLNEYIKTKDVTLEDKIKIMINILNGVILAHENGIIHRDLNPNNIMICNPDELKIIDFGISKIKDYIYDSNTTVKCYMTVEYAAPEQLLRSDTKFESDIYSLGLILAYLISEKVPPKNKDQVYDYISEIPISQNLKDLMHNMTKYKVDDRINSIYKIKRILEKELDIVKSENKKLYITFNSFIRRRLEELGIEIYSSNEHVIKFIKEDLSESSIYKNFKSNEYYLIGTKIKYTCELDKSRKFFIINRVNYIEDMEEHDRLYEKGLKINLSWYPNTKQIYVDDSYVENIIEQLNDYNRINKVEKRRLRNELLEKWNKYLQEEFKLTDEKNRISKYRNLKLDDTGYKIYVELFDTKESNYFNVEDKVHLTDKKNKQISVGIFEDINENIVTIRLDRNVNPNDLSDMGNIGIDVSSEKNSLRKFARALNSIKMSNCVNVNLSNIINDPSIAFINKIVHIDKNDYFQQVLSNSTSEASFLAVEKALSTEDIFLIQGPPGTGKTTVITEIVCQILKKDSDAKILLASQSNVAVDNVINKVLKYLPNKRIIRLGRSEKISEESKNLMISEQLNRWIESVKQKSKQGLDDYLNLHKDIINKDIENIVEEWNKRLGKLDEFDEIFANDSSIIASTCLGIASRNIVNDMDFDWVIIDEAARATPLELLVPIVRGKKIILVGDHRQLPPVVKTNIDKIKLEEVGIKEYDLEKSLFEEFYSNMNDQTKLVLTSQFRMHPDISKMIADIFYPNIDITTDIDIKQRQHMLEWKPKTIKWIDTSRCKDNMETSGGLGQSKKNNKEASIILKELENIESSYRKKNISGISVSVISGYNEQKKLLNNLINPNDKSKWKNIKIIIDNVDAFQGSETDITIYSLVRNNKKGKIGFLYDNRRLNVALSRGKNALIIVGNINFAEKADSFRGNPFKDIIRFMKKNKRSCIIEVYNEN